MSKLMPEDWRLARLGEFCDGVRGVSYKPDDLSPVTQTSTVTLLRSTNIQAGSLDFAEVQHVDEKKVAKKQLAKVGDVAVCMSNGSKRLVGKAAVFKSIPRGSRYTVGAFCSIFRPVASAHPGFVAQLFNSDEFQSQVDFSLAGSAINNLKNSDLLEYQFAKPPLAEQQKIAAILSSVDDVIEKTRAQIDKLKDLKTGMMQELLSKGIGHTEFKDSPVGRIPTAWSVKRIGEVCSDIVDCVNKTAPVVDYVTPYRMIRTTNVRDGRIVREGMRYVTKDTFEAWSRRISLQKGDLIFTREAPVGQCGLLGDPAGLFLGQRTMVYRADATKIDNIFLLTTMQSNYFRCQIEDLSGGSTTPHLRVPDCSKIWLRVPPLTEQKEISRSMRAVDGTLDKKERKLERLAAIKKALMQDLLTGKVRVKVHNKESAAASSSATAAEKLRDYA